MTHRERLRGTGTFTALFGRRASTRGYIRCLWLLLWLLCAGGVYADTESLQDTLPLTLRSASEPDYPPLAEVTQSGEADGFAVELLRAALEAVGRDVRFAVGPWHEIKQRLADGEVDVLPLVARTPEGEALFDFSIAYLSLHGTIVVRTDAPRIQNIADLQGKTVAVMRGDHTEEFLRRIVAANSIVTTDSFEQALTQLSQGRHDAVVVGDVVGWHLIRQLGLDNLSFTEPHLRLFRHDFCFAVAKGNHELLALLNQGLAQVMADGTLQRLERKWGLGLPTPRYWSVILFSILGSALLIGGLAWLWLRALRTMVKLRTAELQETIVKRKRVEEKLHLWQHVFTHADWGIVLCVARTDCFDYVNPSFARQRGYSVEEMQGMRVADLFPAEMRGAVPGLLDRVEQNGYLRIEAEHVRKDGSRFPVQIEASAVYDTHGELAYWVAYVQDISERKAVEQRLRLFEQMVSATRDLMSFVDSDYTYRMVNQAYVESWGRPRHTVLGRHVAELVGEEKFFKKIKPRFDACLAGEEVRYQDWFTFADGEHYLDVVYYPHYDEKHNISGIVISRHDITQLQAAEQFIRATIDSLAAHLCVVDEDGMILMVNRAWREFAAANPPVPVDYCEGCNYLKVCDQACGRHTSAETDSFAQGLDAVLRGDEEAFQMIYPCSSDTEPRWFQVSVTRFQENGRRRAVIAHENITEHVLAEHNLARAKEAAEAASHAKSSFLANMSHELRTPLNAVLGYAQILQRDSTLTATQRQSVETIKRSGDYLLVLINDVLDLAKIEVGRLELWPEPCAIESFFAELSDMFSLHALDKGIRFHYQTSGNLPAVLQVDSKRLRQVCMNLLGNAVKFTEQGEVHLETDYCDGSLLIRVRDTGIGISSELHEAIFKPFRQAGDDQYKQQGTGLGLAICHSLVQQMGGDIQLQSEAGAGSCFCVCIPLPSVDSTAQPLSYNAATPTAGVSGYLRRDGAHEKFRVLVVDDKDDNRDVLHKLLEPLGFEFREASDGTEAVALTEREAFDVILMDMVMPKLDGLTATRCILARPGTRNRLIIAVSAGAFAENRAASLAAGCAAHLTKPVESEALLRMLQTYLPLQWRGNEDKIRSHPEVSDSGGKISNPGASSLPAASLMALEKAVQRGERQQIVEFVQALEPQHAAPATMLQRWVERYEYQKILDWIEKTLREGAT